MASYFWGQHEATKAGANPQALFLGDSWFWYPIGNLPQAIGRHFPNRQFLMLGRNGSDAVDWLGRDRREIDSGFKLYGDSAQALLLSGGGNDIAGSSDFLRLVQADCSAATAVSQCFAPGQPMQAMATIEAAYRDVISRFRQRNAKAPVLLHNYDHAWPTGKGLFGPADWLRAPMEAAKVPKALRRPLFKALVQALHEMQQSLAADPALGEVIALRSAGTLPDKPSEVQDWWANELHPTPAGFKRLAEVVFVPALRGRI